MPDPAAGPGSGALRLPLRFRDLDAFGHVYHAEYLTLLDEARTAWFRDGLRLDDAGDYVLARVEVDYVSSLVRTDRWVSASFAVERVGSTSLTLREELHADDGRVVARGRSVCVLRDVASSPAAAHERHAPTVTRETLTDVVAAVPEVWLEQAPGLETPEAVRAAYVDHLLARVANASAWLPGDAS